MNRKTDVVVVGSGIAGMSAALAAAEQGKKVTLLTHGTGAVAISGGCIDVLGYCYGTPVVDPLQAISDLAEGHPYSIIGGAPSVGEAVEHIRAICSRYGLELCDAAGLNTRLITVMGTLKPSYLYPSTFGTESLSNIHRACIATVEGLKDVHPRLIIDQLSRYDELSDISFFEAVLPCPIPDAYRNLTPVDVARFVERPDGEKWLLESLAPYARLYPVIILPPVLGLEHCRDICERLSTHLGVHLIETVSIPPTPAGLRLNGALRRAMNDAGVCVVENVEAVSAEVDGGICRALITNSISGENRWAAESFVIATGGVLGGGIVTEPGMAHEKIFGIPIEMPESVEDWSSADIFGKSAFASMGVRVDSELRPLSPDGEPLYVNVRMAGRILGGYDFAAEKSGNGVAVATGWHAGKLAGKE